MATAAAAGGDDDYVFEPVPPAQLAAAAAHEAMHYYPPAVSDAASNVTVMPPVSRHTPPRHATPSPAAAPSPDVDSVCTFRLKLAVGLALFAVLVGIVVTLSVTSGKGGPTLSTRDIVSIVGGVLLGAGFLLIGIIHLVRWRRKSRLPHKAVLFTLLPTAVAMAEAGAVVLIFGAIEGQSALSRFWGASVLVVGVQAVLAAVIRATLPVDWQQAAWPVMCFAPSLVAITLLILAAQDMGGGTGSEQPLMRYHPAHVMGFLSVLLLAGPLTALAKPGPGAVLFVLAALVQAAFGIGCMLVSHYATTATFIVLSAVVCLAAFVFLAPTSAIPAPPWAVSCAALAVAYIGLIISTASTDADRSSWSSLDVFGKTTSVVGPTFLLWVAMLLLFVSTAFRFPAHLFSEINVFPLLAVLLLFTTPALARVAIDGYVVCIATGLVAAVAAVLAALRVERMRFAVVAAPTAMVSALIFLGRASWYDNGDWAVLLAVGATMVVLSIVTEIGLCRDPAHWAALVRASGGLLLAFVVLEALLVAGMVVGWWHGPAGGEGYYTLGCIVAVTVGRTALASLTNAVPWPFMLMPFCAPVAILAVLLLQDHSSVSLSRHIAHRVELPLLVSSLAALALFLWHATLGQGQEKGGKEGEEEGEGEERRPKQQQEQEQQQHHHHQQEEEVAGDAGEQEEAAASRRRNGRQLAWLRSGACPWFLLQAVCFGAVTAHLTFGIYNAILWLTAVAVLLKTGHHLLLHLASVGILTLLFALADAKDSGSGTEIRLAVFFIAYGGLLLVCVPLLSATGFFSKELVRAQPLLCVVFGGGALIVGFAILAYVTSGVADHVFRLAVFCIGTAAASICLAVRAPALLHAASLTVMAAFGTWCGVKFRNTETGAVALACAGALWLGCAAYHKVESLRLFPAEKVGNLAYWAHAWLVLGVLLAIAGICCIVADHERLEVVGVVAGSLLFGVANLVMLLRIGRQGWDGIQVAVELILGLAMALSYHVSATPGLVSLGMLATVWLSRLAPMAVAPASVWHEWRHLRVLPVLALMPAAACGLLTIMDLRSPSRYHGPLVEYKSLVENQVEYPLVVATCVALVQFVLFRTRAAAAAGDALWPWHMMAAASFWQAVGFGAGTGEATYGALPTVMILVAAAHLYAGFQTIELWLTVGGQLTLLFLLTSEALRYDGIAYALLALGAVGMACGLGLREPTMAARLEAAEHSKLPRLSLTPLAGAMATWQSAGAVCGTGYLLAGFAVFDFVEEHQRVFPLALFCVTCAFAMVSMRVRTVLLVPVAISSVFAAFGWNLWIMFVDETLAVGIVFLACGCALLGFYLYARVFRGGRRDGQCSEWSDAVYANLLIGICCLACVLINVGVFAIASAASDASLAELGLAEGLLLFLAAHVVLYALARGRLVSRWWAVVAEVALVISYGFVGPTADTMVSLGLALAAAALRLLLVVATGEGCPVSIVPGLLCPPVVVFFTLLARDFGDRRAFANDFIGCSACVAPLIGACSLALVESVTLSLLAAPSTAVSWVTQLLLWGGVCCGAPLGDATFGILPGVVLLVAAGTLFLNGLQVQMHTTLPLILMLMALSTADHDPARHVGRIRWQYTGIAWLSYGGLCLLLSVCGVAPRARDRSLWGLSQADWPAASRRENVVFRLPLLAHLMGWQAVTPALQQQATRNLFELAGFVWCNAGMIALTYTSSSTKYTIPVDYIWYPLVGCCLCIIEVIVSMVRRSAEQLLVATFTLLGFAVFLIVYAIASENLSESNKTGELVIFIIVCIFMFVSVIALLVQLFYYGNIKWGRNRVCCVNGNTEEMECCFCCDVTPAAQPRATALQPPPYQQHIAMQPQRSAQQHPGSAVSAAQQAYHLGTLSAVRHHVDVAPPHDLGLLCLNGDVFVGRPSASLLPGDQVLSINMQAVNTWSQDMLDAFLWQQMPLSLELERFDMHVPADATRHVIIERLSLDQKFGVTMTWSSRPPFLVIASSFTDQLRAGHEVCRVNGVAPVTKKLQELIGTLLQRSLRLHLEVFLESAPWHITNEHTPAAQAQHVESMANLPGGTRTTHQLHVARNPDASFGMQFEILKGEGLLVRKVKAGTPSDGVLQVDDLVVVVNGIGAQDPQFPGSSSDALRAFLHHELTLDLLVMRKESPVLHADHQHPPQQPNQQGDQEDVHLSHYL